MYRPKKVTTSGADVNADPRPDRLDRPVYPCCDPTSTSSTGRPESRRRRLLHPTEDPAVGRRKPEGAVCVGAQ
jgi:hypothetical protein